MFKYHFRMTDKHSKYFSLQLMTKKEQKLYDVIADWWGDAETQDKDPIIADLVHSIMDLKYNNVPEDADYD